MYKVLRVLIITILLTLVLRPVGAFAEEKDAAADSYYSQLDEILADNAIDHDTEELSRQCFSETVDEITDLIGWDSSDVLGLLGTILVIVVITAALKSVGESFKESCRHLWNCQRTYSCNCHSAKAFRGLWTCVRCGAVRRQLYCCFHTCFRGGLCSHGRCDVGRFL